MDKRVAVESLSVFQSQGSCFASHHERWFLGAFRSNLYMFMFLLLKIFWSIPGMHIFFNDG